jgi:hypothetical protein
MPLKTECWSSCSKFEALVKAAVTEEVRSILRCLRWNDKRLSVEFEFCFVEEASKVDEELT